MPKAIVLHHEFKDISYVDGDIALVILSKKFELNRFVQKVCLPHKNEGELARPSTSGAVAGWGVTRALRPADDVHHNELSKVLRHRTFTIQSDLLCLNKSKRTYNSTMAFCAGDGKGGSDTCKGDSGWAFVRKIRRGHIWQWVAVGIVSWGNGCAQRDEYGYYTRVYHFIDWINKTMKSCKYCFSFFFDMEIFTAEWQ